MNLTTAIIIMRSSPIDPERDGEAPSLTPSLEEEQVSGKVLLLGWPLGKGAWRGLLEGLSSALGLFKMKLLQKPTLWSSRSHCESPESHSLMSEEIVMINMGKTFRLVFLRQSTFRYLELTPMSNYLRKSTRMSTRPW